MAPTWERYVTERAAAAVLRRGPEGRDWLAGLAGTFDQICAAMSLELTGRLSGGAQSAVMTAADRSGEDVVVKVTRIPSVARAEYDTLLTWQHHRAPTAQSAFPAPLACFDELGALVMSFLDGTPGHKAPLGRRSVPAAAPLFETLAATSPVSSAPLFSDRFSAPFRAAHNQLAALTGPCRHVARFCTDLDMAAVAARRSVAAHGDLWAGNLMVSADRVAMFDPEPVAVPLEWDVARFCADGHAGPGAHARAEETFDLFDLDRRMVTQMMAAAAAAQLSTYLTYRWDPMPVAPGLADTFADAGVRVSVDEIVAAVDPLE